MAIVYHKPSKDHKKDLQLTFGLTLEEIHEQKSLFLPAEWHPQSGVQLTWPHNATDWHYYLDKIEACYIEIAKAIAAEELLLIVTPEVNRVKQLLEKHLDLNQVRFVECNTNDTWARDHSFITLVNKKETLLLDFRFNGWGMKFAANFDNQINREIYQQKKIKGKYRHFLNFVLEGGAIESDGAGTLFTTTDCLCAPNRNEHLSKKEIERFLIEVFHLKRVCWINHGYLAGDDTDHHIDTLVRICPNETITYVQCLDPDDEHYTALHEMEKELEKLQTLQGKPYRLLPLPMANAIYDEEGERLPATYANFLILNQTILCPTYQQPENDKKAIKVLQKAFPGRKIIGIDCCILIQQHGSLHCATMQFPNTVLF